MTGSLLGAWLSVNVVVRLAGGILLAFSNPDRLSPALAEPAHPVSFGRVAAMRNRTLALKRRLVMV
jgi:hypothetical protein